MKTSDKLGNVFYNNPLAIEIVVLAIVLGLGPILWHFSLDDPFDPEAIRLTIEFLIVGLVCGSVVTLIWDNFVFPRRRCVGVSKSGISLRIWRRQRLLRWEDLETIRILRRPGDLLSKISIKSSAMRPIEVSCKGSDISLESMIEQERPTNQNMEVLDPPSSFKDWIKDNSPELVVNVLCILAVVFLMIILLYWGF